MLVARRWEGTDGRHAVIGGLGSAARRALLGLIGRVVVGEGITAGQRSWVEVQLPLSGFRRTAQGLIVRVLMRAGLKAGPVTIITPALGGLFRIACTAIDTGVGWEILGTGTYEPHIVEYYRRTIRPGMVVADIGANIGFHTLHAATLVGPHGRVVAVEPDRENAALLRLSLSLAAAPLPVEVVEAALSDEPGELVHTDLGNAANSGARFTGKDRARLETLVHGLDPVYRQVPAFRWDDRYLDTRPDLVKIDIEGFEPIALRGMQSSIERHRPIILSEFAPGNLEKFGGTTALGYLAWFRQRGYRVALLEAESGRSITVTDEEATAALAGRHHVDLAFEPVQP